MTEPVFDHALAVKHEARRAVRVSAREAIEVKRVRTSRGQGAREHAVVIGGSIGGLLAARVLADAHERVTVIEREALPVGNEGRKAVPQGRHVHALTPRGLQAMEGLLPGLGDELVEDGAVTGAPYNDVRGSIAGSHEYARAALGISQLFASRPFIEGHVRRRVLGLDNIALRERCEVRGLVATPDRRRVTGVRVAAAGDGAEAVIEARPCRGGHRSLGQGSRMAGGARLRVPAGVEPEGRHRLRDSKLPPAAGGADGQGVRRLRAAGDAARNVPVLPGARFLAAHPQRLRGPSTAHGGGCL